MSDVKYAIIIPDGMADWKNAGLGGKTPMQAAKKPVMDMLASKSVCGMTSNVPEGMVPESDTANLAILGYDPAVYSRGRSPLEALSMGLDMREGDVAFRCNVVTLSEEGEYGGKAILDHSADEITTEEARYLIEALQQRFGTSERTFYTGISYRHCMIWNNPPSEDGERIYDFTRPHDILGKTIGQFLPKGEVGEHYARIMKESYDILNRHPVNEERRRRGLKPANSAWFWSPGTKPALPPFKEKTGLTGCVISAVDLVKGIGICAGMKSIDVEGATGNIHTNFKGKAAAAIEAFKSGEELVYIHIEAPDECGHRAELENKVKSIEIIDRDIVAPVLKYLEESGSRFKILILPDHPTPVAIRTHTREAIPFLIYDSAIPANGITGFDEDSASSTGLRVEHGYKLIDMLIQGIIE